MTHTLAQLKSGELKGVKRLKIAEGLREFPEEVVALAETLEVLDLSDNLMSELPDSVAKLKRLRIIFFARNRFKQFPKVLSQCPELSMIGFKSNQIDEVPEGAFPPKLRWLILTDNQIPELPTSIGGCEWLQKCGLAGNQLKTLPAEMANCRNLELLRVSANQLTALPDWLLRLPKLSWLAFAGNPCPANVFIDTDLPAYDWSDFEEGTLIGEGASGFISNGHWKSADKVIALKLFKGAVTSDGWPKDEMNGAIAAGTHPQLIPVVGKIANHPEGKDGVVMELIAPTYVNLGNPPSLVSCTRDVFDEELVYGVADLRKIAKDMAAVSLHLHSRGVNHGDLYAHNILVNDTADCLLGDFGAASIYDTNTPQAAYIERIGVRAYACLLEDVLGLVKDITSQERSYWLQLIADCMHLTVNKRPSFGQILERLG